MLKTIAKSSNKKLGNCASTYRSGTSDVFGTCPSSCEFKPSSSRGAGEVDVGYVEAVKNAVPQGGVSWTYTHFNPADVLKTESGQTCINISTESLNYASEVFSSGFPTVVVAPSFEDRKVFSFTPDNSTSNIKVVRCPAEYSDITCATCGGDVPLCARQDRDYVIKFTAHGTQKGKVNSRLEGSSTESGGCYGTSGPVRLQWEKTRSQVIPISIPSDSEILLNFSRSLPTGAKLRHHVVGDLGLIT